MSPWRKQQSFQRIATTLAALNAEGLTAQAVNDLLTMYVGAASQHVLRMRFVPEQEVLLLKLGGLGVGSAVQRHAAAPWRAWQSIIPTLMATTKSPDTDSLFNATPRLRAQLTQLQNTLSLKMNKPAFQLKPLGAALRLKKHSKETSLHYPKEYPQATLRQPRRHPR